MRIARRIATAAIITAAVLGFANNGQDVPPAGSAVPTVQVGGAEQPVLASFFTKINKGVKKVGSITSP